MIDTVTIEELATERREQATTGTKRFRASYVSEPEEITERMAQFKNYFAMSATEQFTNKHLAHICSQYVSDTRLDNGISDLLRCVTTSTERAFLSIINKYPI